MPRDSQIDKGSSPAQQRKLRLDVTTMAQAGNIAIPMASMMPDTELHKGSTQWYGYIHSSVVGICL